MARRGHRRVGRYTLGAETIAEDAYVAAVTSRLPEGDRPDALRLMAVDARTGRLLALGPRDGISVGRGVAAARAAPGVLPAVTVGWRRLRDAGRPSRERLALEAAGVTAHVVRADDHARAAMGEQLFGIVDAAAAVDAGRATGRTTAGSLLAAAP